jgi:hypothetical protein
VEEKQLAASPRRTPAPSVAVAEPLVVPLRGEAPTQRYLRIIDAKSGNRLVTAIEFLSPTNKKTKAGRTAYRKKQRELTGAAVNLVEIDLLREGQYVLVAPQASVPLKYQRPYRVCVFRASRPDQAEVYSVSLRKPLPSIRIPLRETDADVSLDLQKLVDQSYQDGGYEDIDYKSDPVPPLSAADEKWADALLRKTGLR